MRAVVASPMVACIFLVTGILGGSVHATPIELAADHAMGESPAGPGHDAAGTGHEYVGGASVGFDGFALLTDPAYPPLSAAGGRPGHGARSAGFPFRAGAANPGGSGGMDALTRMITGVEAAYRGVAPGLDTEESYEGLPRGAYVRAVGEPITEVSPVVELNDSTAVRNVHQSTEDWLFNLQFTHFTEPPSTHSIPIPEPGTVSIVLMGVAGLAWRRRHV